MNTAQTDNRPLKQSIQTILLVIACCVYGQVSFAQNTGGNNNLPEVKVKGKKNEKVSEDDKLNKFSPGQKIVHIDSIVLQQYKFQNMANLLSQQTSAFVKSYGFNGLATLNFRGSSSAQSQVLWNGVPLQNAALGIADISTLPVALIDRVNILYGSSSALWGSGNVGGALMLENDLPTFDSVGKKDISLSLGAGSFNQYAGGARVAFNDRKWYISANGFIQSAKNEFSYLDNSDVERQNLNAKLYSFGFMFNGAYLISPGNTFSISAWFQNFDREIPAALFETSSVKDRVDQSKRVMLHWKKEQDRGQTYFKSALIEDRLIFNDEAISLATRNTSYQSYNEFGVKRLLGKHHTVLFFLPVNYSWMKDVVGNQLRAGLSAAYAIDLFKNRLNVSVQASQQFIDDRSAFLPGINASYYIFDWLKIRANVQKTYRAPTLNELYYQPGGNKNLLPEQGWTQDAGYSVKTNLGNLGIYHDVSVFNRDIKDWILWFGGAIWTPHNIAEVKSRGVETENKLTYKLNNCLLHVGLNTAYVIATTQRSYIANDNSIGKQIPYAPRYNGQFNLGITYKTLYFNYNHAYTGYRFYTTDESGWVVPYSTANVQLSYLFRIGRDKSVLLSGQANNLFNTHYQVVAQRPMPGLNFLIGARFNLLN